MTIPYYNEVKPGQIFPPSKTITNFSVALVNDLIRQLNEQSGYIITPEMFGAVCDGVTDDTAPLREALEFCFLVGATCIIDKPTATKNIVIASGAGSVICTTGEIICIENNPSPAVFASELLIFQSGVINSTFNLKVGMAGRSKSGVAIEGDNNRVISCVVRDIVMTSLWPYVLAGLRVSGDNVSIGRVEAIDFVVGTPITNGVFALAVLAYAEDVHVGEIYATGAGCLINNGNGTQVQSMISRGAGNNTLYNIELSEDLWVGQITVLDSTDEAVACSGDLRPYIGSVYCWNCQRGVGLRHTVRAVIGDIVFENDGTIDSGSALYLRVNNTVVTSLTVGSLTVNGGWTSGAPLWTLEANTGSLPYFSIGEVNAKLQWTDAAVAASATKALAFMSDLDGMMNIDSLNIELNDATGGLTGSDIFFITIPSTLTLPSRIGGVLLSNAGGSFAVHLRGATNPNLFFDGPVNIRTDLSTSPVSNRNGFTATSRQFWAGAAPVLGDWLKGDIVWSTVPAVGGNVGWICTTAGAPGTWTPFGFAGTISEASYTPTVTPGTNVDSATASICYWYQIGNKVHVFGTVAADATAAGSTLTELGVSLPVASAFSSFLNLSGVGVIGNTGLVKILGDATNDRASFNWASASTSNLSITFEFSYTVI